MSHANGIKAISQNTGPGGDLDVFIEDDDKVTTLKEAYKNEILLEADVENNNARNSYASLSKSIEEGLGEIVGEDFIE